MFFTWRHGSPEQRVARGIKYLDARHPGWASSVTPDKIDLDSSTNCVLGQVYGDYNEHPVIRDRFLGLLAWSWAHRHGFVADHNGGYRWPNPDRMRLEDLWVMEVRQRRSAEILAS